MILNMAYRGHKWSFATEAEMHSMFEQKFAQA